MVTAGNMKINNSCPCSQLRAYNLVRVGNIYDTV